MDRTTPSAGALLRGAALAFVALLAPACRTASERPAETLADSVAGFSGTQGANGWTYGYWDRSADPDGRYAAGDFRPFPRFGRDPVVEVTSRGDFIAGPLWTLGIGNDFTAIWADAGSSNGTTRLAPQVKADRWAVRRFTSRVDAAVTIRGTAARILEWGTPESGQAWIVVDGATVFATPTTTSPRGFAVDAVLKAGSVVDFLVTAAPEEAGGAFGPVRFVATIRTKGVPD